MYYLAIMFIVGMSQTCNAAYLTQKITTSLFWPANYVYKCAVKRERQRTCG